MLCALVAAFGIDRTALPDGGQQGCATGYAFGPIGSGPISPKPAERSCIQVASQFAAATKRSVPAHTVNFDGMEFPRFCGNFSLDEGECFTCREQGTRTRRNSGIRHRRDLHPHRSPQPLQRLRHRRNRPFGLRSTG